MAKTKLVSFDLDDTLIRGIHSVMMPCILNNKEKEHAVIQAREENGDINYMEADYLRAKLLLGLDEGKIELFFLHLFKPLKNIKETVKELHKNNMKCIIVTVGPKQVAQAACKIWGFDDCYGSDYEVVEGKFTGNISDYISADEKVACLEDYCKMQTIKPQETVAVGDGSTDIPMFNYCGKSIAINASPHVKNSASHFIDTDDLMDILQYILF